MNTTNEVVIQAAPYVRTQDGTYVKTPDAAAASASQPPILGGETAPIANHEPVAGVYATTTVAEGVWVPISQIIIPEEACPHTQEDIDSRAVSMARDGQEQNALLSKEGDKLVLVYGHGRLLSAQKNNWEKLRCDIKEGLTEAQKLLLALAENAERENESPFHTATVYQKLMAAKGLTQEQLAQEVGKDISLVERYLSLMKVTPAVTQTPHACGVSLRQCLAIAKLTKVEDQLKVMEECATQDLAGKALEKRVKELLNPAKGDSEASAKPAVAVEEKPFQFRWKDGKLLIKAVYAPGELNFIQFTCDMDDAYSAFVKVHPAPAVKSAHPEGATAQPAA